MMKYAIISDIHGNYPALRLALNDAIEQGAEGFLFVGDYCVSAPWPKEVAEVLSSTENAHIIRGNEERYLRVPEGDDGQMEISRWCKHTLSEQQRDWLCNLPERIDFQCEGMDIHIAHSSDAFIGEVEISNFSPFKIALRYPEGIVPQEDLLQDIRGVLESDASFQQALRALPGGIYIFGHTHVQWHMEIGNHLFINPGSCGLPLDCAEFGAPYTLLTVENGVASVEERRVKYDAYKLIEQVKETTQYTEASVWSEVIFTEWLTGREKVFFFLKHVEEYAKKINDSRRPYARDTWQAAFEMWQAGAGRDYIKWIRSKVGNEKIILAFADGCIFNDKGEVLLQRRGDSNKWGFPGGAIELGETPKMAAVREVKEETGLDVTVGKLIGVYTDCNVEYPNGDRAQCICMAFEVQVTGGELFCDQKETLELKYFPLDDMPKLFCKQHEDIMRDIKSKQYGVVR